MASEIKTYEWKDATSLGRAVVRLLLLSNLLTLAGIATYLIYGEAAVVSEGAKTLTHAQSVRQVIAMAQVSLSLFCIAVPVWLWRVNANAHVLKPDMKFSPLGALGFYFVPFVSLWLPFQAMAETWRVSTGRGEASPVLQAWWGCFLASGMLGVAAILLLKGSQALTAEIFADAFGILCTVCLIQIVREITDGQQARRPATLTSDRTWVV